MIGEPFGTPESSKSQGSHVFFQHTREKPGWRPPQKWIVTPLKTNMEPKNGGLEDDIPFQTGDFQVPC